MALYGWSTNRDRHTYIHSHKQLGNRISTGSFLYQYLCRNHNDVRLVDPQSLVQNKIKNAPFSWGVFLLQTKHTIKFDIFIKILYH